MKTTSFAPHKSSLGLDANILVMLLYAIPALLGALPLVEYIAWLAPLVFFFLEKNSKFVKFAAVQSLFISVAQTVIGIFFAIVTFIVTPRGWGGLLSFFGARTAAMTVVWVLSLIVDLLFLALFVFILVKAYGYKQVELPLIGPLAHKFSDKLDSMNIDINKKSNASQPKVTCAGCGAENPAGTKFCGTCGKNMEE